MEAIRLTFFQECEEQLVEMESGLQTMSEGDLDSEIVNAVFRAVHSIKGGAGAFKLQALVQFAHTFETALDHVRSGKLAPSADVMKVMMRAADVLSDLVQAARDGNSIPEASYEAVANDVRSLTNAGGQPEEEEVIDFQPMVIDFAPAIEIPDVPLVNTYTISFKPHADLYRKANETLLLFRELERLGEIHVACDDQAVPTLDAFDPDETYLSWTIELTTENDRPSVEEVFEFVDGECDLKVDGGNETPAADIDIAALLAQVASEPTVAFSSNSPTAEGVEPAPVGMTDVPPQAEAPVFQVIEGSKGEAKNSSSAAAPSQGTIRVEFDRVDRLINLVGELVINQSMLSQRVAEADFPGSSSIMMGLDELEQLTREIQESVMAIRAQPVKPLFQRMSRIVREVADATGKEVRLRTDGEGTEVDKTVVERLAEPLTHMIRNAVDHGIESPEVRVANGKPAEGAVRLSAAHRSGRIVIEIEDDGAGINRQKVKESAIKKGLIPADAQLSDSEIDNLLFLPGFSTAATVSNISGRGVGMDVVKRSINALGGRISIASRPGKGSTFSLSLPLTLAVLDGMVVTVNEETLVVPLTAIIETLKPRVSDIHTLGADGRVIAIRNTIVPLIDVGCELGLRNEPADPENCVVILVEVEGGGRSALLVDGIQDQRQVVIKSLDVNYQTIPGIAAATILGDGRVALILDVDGVLQLSRGDSGAQELRTGTGG